MITDSMHVYSIHGLFDLLTVDDMSAVQSVAPDLCFLHPKLPNLHLSMH